MSTIKNIKVKSMRGCNVRLEMFSSSEEVVTTSAERPITDRYFEDTRNKRMSKGWEGVENWSEAERLMKNGHQPTVDRMKETLKNVNISGSSKRIKFTNDVVGYAPIVPLALQGVPNCMQNSRMTPINTKVLDIYYDCGAPSLYSAEDMLKAGQKLLGVILELEAQGYKFNLYAIGGQCDGDVRTADVMCVKIKSSNTPLDLKRISFPMAHPAFARVIKFDWYSRFPQGKYRSSYGYSLGIKFSEEELTRGFEEMFGRKCVAFCCSKLIRNDEEHIREAIKNAGR